MIIESTHNVKTNLKGSKEFEVSEDSAKIFSFLSNFLYKDKERSVITELCSNALDAHVMVGKEDLPIHVHLPTDLQKEFRVRDFGPGLSEQDVYTFLTKYGSSSKGASNEFIGGFGIGSKSPAAVTDSWTINSFHGGKETTYLIHVNDRGIPSINKLMAVDSSETGLEVVVPCRNASAWHVSATAVFANYDVLPNIKGTSHTIKKHEYIETDNPLVKFAAHDTTGGYYASNTSCTVLMNRRLYQVDMNKFAAADFGIAVNIFFRPFTIPFETSSLSVSLSREDLQYDSKTISSLAAKFKDIEKYMQEQWKKEVSPNSANIFDYQLAANTFKETRFVTSAACKRYAKVCKDTFAETVNYDKLNTFNVEFDLNYFNVQVFDHDDLKVKGLVANRYGYGLASVKLSYDRYGSDQTKRLSFVVKDKNAITFVSRDVNDAPSRVRQALSQNKMKTVVIIDPSWYAKVNESFHKILASSLEKVPHIKGATRDKVESNIWEMCGNHFERIDTKEVYSNKTDLVCGFFSNATSTNYIIGDHKNFMINHSSSMNLIFVRVGEKVPKHAITIDAWLEKKYKEFNAKEAEYIKYLKKHEITNVYRYSVLGHMLNNNNTKFFEDFDNSTIIGEIVNEVTDIKSIQIPVGGLNEIKFYDSVSKALGKGTKSFTVDTGIFEEKLKVAYPMLSLLGGGYLQTDNISIIIDYIKQCGK